ncbi:MAG: aquaporin [Limisphaerales bacterium]
MKKYCAEFLGTFILVFAGTGAIILNVSTGAKEKGITAGIAVGAVIGLEALFAGPVCGASMNPARSLGPAVMAGEFSQLWLYLVAPALGALSAILACRCVQAEGCCTKGADCQPA